MYTSRPTSTSRVCDRCILKKVKCNRQRPSCSRCIEEQISCVYSHLKRKPGPGTGARLKKLEKIAASSSSDLQHLSSASTRPALQEAQQSTISLNYPSSQAIHTAKASMERTSSCFMGNHGLVDENYQTGSTESLLLPAQERQLIEDFFTFIQPSIPLFQKKPFLERYERGNVNRNLLLTLLGITAQTQAGVTSQVNPVLKSNLDNQLSIKSVEEESLDHLFSLQSFQQAYLLAFYQFHQCPGEEAWQRISELTRRAYRYGLDQIDNQDHCPLYDHNSMIDIEIEEWRYLWWCIYCLDSYCNITAGTPFVIGLDSIRTALIQSRPFTSNSSEGANAIFLPAETEQLWKTAKEIVACPGDPNPGLHIVTTTLLNQASTLLRLWKQNPSARLKARFSTLEDHISAVQLALPTDYLNVARTVNESSAEYHARLICILHLHASRLLISLPIQESVNTIEWLFQWQRTFTYCEDVVAVVRQWEAQLCQSADPAICFIIVGVLILLHLHYRDDANTDTVLQAKILAQKGLLVLLLEQFASIWQLPRLLIVSFQNFAEKFSGHLTLSEIDQILWKIQGLMHRSWFKLVSLAPHDLQRLNLQHLNNNVIAEFDFSDWEPLANISNVSFVLNKKK